MKLFTEVRSEKGKSVSKSGNYELVVDFKDQNRLTFLTLMVLPSDEDHRNPFINIIGGTKEVVEQLKEEIAKFEEAEIKM